MAFNSHPREAQTRHVDHWEHLARPFGVDAFGARAETFARFFGTPRFLVGQTAIVGMWILMNAVGLVRFDTYPFILLNLAFSLQAAYAAPLILLAATRQADRDKAHAERDAEHREDVAQQAARQQRSAEHQITLITRLLDENTRLTEQTRALTEELQLSVTGRTRHDPSSPLRQRRRSRTTKPHGVHHPIPGIAVRTEKESQILALESLQGLTPEDLIELSEQLGIGAFGGHLRLPVEAHEVE